MDARIAVAAHSLSSGFAGLMYAQIRKQARPGLGIVECGVVERQDRELLRTRLLGFLSGDPKPLALIGICLKPDLQTLADLRAARIPVVLIDEEAVGATTVACDNQAGGVLAAQHLLDRGRKAIALVVGELETNGSYNAVQRLSGFRRGLSERGRSSALTDVVEVADYSRKDGVAALGRLLGRRLPFDAVFCAAGDVCATGVLAAAREQSLKVPEDVAVLGYDDHEAARASLPQLSTLRQPIEEIAATAWRLASEETAAILAKPRKVLLKPTLVHRAST